MAKTRDFVLFLSMLWICAGCSSSGPSNEVVLFEGALFLLDDTKTPPLDSDPRWQPVRLPDRWDERLPGRGGIGWYRFAVPGARASGERLALSLAGVNMNAETFANGVPIGSGGRMVDPVARNANRPLYWEIPGVLLGKSLNAIDVRLFAYPNDVGSLGAVAFGPDAALRDEYNRRRFLQIEIPQATSALALLLALFFGVLWSGAGRDPLHGWFALSSAAWMFVSLNYWVQNPGIAHWTWVRSFYGALGTFAVTIPIWAHRLLGIRRKAVEGALLSVLVLYAVLAAITSDAVFPRLVGPFQAAWLTIGTYGVFVLLRGWRAFSPVEAIVYGVGGLVCTALAAAEQFDAWRFGGGWHPHLMPYIGTVFVLCLATTLGVRFADSLQEARRANRELEERVRAKTAEIEANHLRLRELERSQVLAEERTRIVREMHDGIGGQLVATLAMVQAGENEPRAVANALRDALDDMRAVIDSMDPLIDDLRKLFGSLRGRFESLLRRNDLHVVWSVGELPTTPWLGPEHYLHILRILQEAVTNAIKHAAPSELEVSVEWIGGVECGLLVAVRDDGRKSAASGSGGRGIGHMHIRARALGGQLRIVERHPGTSVELWLPEPGSASGTSFHA